MTDATIVDVTNPQRAQRGAVQLLGGSARFEALITFQLW
jgi:hypothetical protein